MKSCGRAAAAKAGYFAWEEVPRSSPRWSRTGSLATSRSP